MIPVMKVVVGALLLDWALTCETSYQLDQSGCTFYMTYTDAQCYAFTFTQCTQRAKYRTYTYTVWSDCIYNCCLLTDALANNLGSIYACQDAIYSYNKLVGLIIGSAVGGLLLIVIVAILTLRRCCFFQAFSQLNELINQFILRWVERRSRARIIHARRVDPTQEQLALPF